MNSSVKSLSPVIDRRAKALILGAVPGKESLEKQQYYANSRNSFWKIIFSLYDFNVEESYNKRIDFIQEKSISLWDVIKVCDREGSLDSNIKNEKTNDFASLFKEYPNIEFVLFNGTKAYEVFRKQVGFNISDKIIFKKLTSTSPANTISIERKIMEWKIIKDYLG